MQQNEGGYLGKTDDDIDCCAPRVGNDGHVGQRANPSAGSGKLARADSEGDPGREAGGMPGTGSAFWHLADIPVALSNVHFRG
jgi:hypothetical protein